MSSWLYVVKVSSQTVLALLRCRYLHKPRNNSSCPPGDLWDWSRVILVEYKLACWWFTEIMYEDQEQWKAQNKTLKFPCMFCLIIAYNLLSSSFWHPIRSSLISQLTMKWIPILTVFVVANGVQVKMWVSPVTHLYYKEQYLPNLKIIVEHKRKKQKQKQTKKKPQKTPKQNYKIFVSFCS